MNVFEDLLADLKEDNLLEDTILDERGYKDDFEPAVSRDMGLDMAAEPAAPPVAGNHAAPVPDPVSEGAIVTHNEDVARAAQKPAIDGREFFKKRAVAEVSSLQMVEHVLTGVEREYIKIKPHAFDDLKAKLALNKFLKAADQEDAKDAQKSAEFDLMQETEAWCTALAARDTKIYVSSLRQYCENTKPALSSQALLALCRFYRNLPYSEVTRAKYDFLLTRLFTRPIEDETRVCLFKRDEALKHLENLYKDWSSVPLYAVDEDDSKVLLTALSFDELAQESESASSFDQLIESDFFSRLRMFKESIAELFFAPQVAISAVEGNVRIGNAYVKLIAAEHQKMDADTIHAKYMSLDQESVSDATARTLQLVDLLKAPSFDEVVYEPPPAREQVREVPDRKEDKPADDKQGADQTKNFIKRLTENAFAVNKWLLVGATLLVVASIGVYVWANYFVEDSVPNTSVRIISQDDAVFHDYLKTVKVSNDILYGLLTDAWDVLPKQKRVEYVQKLLAKGPELGYTQVNLTSKDGKQAAYGTKDRVDVEMP